MILLKATPKDAQTLTSLTLKSKAYWGYTPQQMALWQDQLTVTPVYIKNHEVCKLVKKDTDSITGYYSYYEEGNTIVLDNLFVLPDYIGRKLLEDFLHRMKQAGTTLVTADVDPNAEGFYAAFGFKTIGHKITQIEGRVLPVMELAF
jgi:hypothetical protein